MSAEPWALKFSIVCEAAINYLKFNLFTAARVIFHP